MSKLIELAPDATLEEVLTDDVTLVDIYSNTCMPCRMLAVELDKVAKEEPVIKINVEHHMDLAIAHGVGPIPHLEIWKNKEKVETFVGYRKADELMQIIEKHK